MKPFIRGMWFLGAVGSLLLVPMIAQAGPGWGQPWHPGHQVPSPHVQPVSRGGPPPWAPAHGYRQGYGAGYQDGYRQGYRDARAQQRGPSHYRSHYRQPPPPPPPRPTYHRDAGGRVDVNVNYRYRF
ncbi:hypothetical protein [Ectothiorhodospira shaposhnikovii]|uniref:hypothetical protein n=1 Tax=Ectothiorhodospira shaposhnikovii TaxID=1054 RepID=UPI001EE79870|nr:hypothetical protein [Ectothiorhodospira shaposhnikovii]MCG5513121.1 hypothetical protein [Ectothiorhodospira shaposhnikovii]